MSVLGIGDCTLDHFGIVERFLDPGMKVEMSKFSVQGGGAAATAIVVLARWGVETSFVGKVGDDLRGQQIEMTLAEEGVDTDDLIREPDAVSQFSFITLENATGQRHMLFTRGTVSDIGASEVGTDQLDGVELLLVDGLQPDSQVKLMKAASQRDIPIILDASDMDPSRKDLVELSDYLLASERFASRFTGVGELDSICNSLLENGPHTVAVTLGDEGVVGTERNGNGSVRAPSYSVDIVDTTGAGDVFAGAFAYGVIEDWTLEKTTLFANYAAGLSCTGIGGRGAIPSFDDVQKRL